MSQDTVRAGASRRLLSVFLGLMLLLAAFLKGHEALTRPAGGDWPSSPAPRAAIILAEVGLGLFLASGMFPHAARLVGGGAFVVLSLFALSRAVTGAESCGCFGPVSVNPWLIVGVDLTAAALLFTLPMPRKATGKSVRRGLASASFAATLAVSAGFLLVWWRPVSSLTDKGDVDGDGRLVAVDPASWPGKRLPLLRHIDVGDRLATGNWVVMFHRADCAPCRDALPAYVGLAQDMARGGGGGVALVEVPPWKEDVSQPAGSTCLRGRLSDAHRWEVRTPLFLALNSGLVEEVSSDPALLLEKGRGVGRALAASDRPGLRSFPDYRQARRDRYLSEIACGPLSLLAVFRVLGLHITPEKEEKLIAEAGDRGIDLLRLKELAESEGMYALGVALRSPDLARLGLPAVIHDGRFGFAAVTVSGSDGVRIVRPFQPAAVFAPADLTKHYGATVAALLVSRKPIDPVHMGVLKANEEKVRGPWLRPERTVVSVGRVYKQSWEATLELRNAGDAPLRIGAVQTKCRGVRVSVAVSTIQPGKTTALRVSGTHAQPGSFTCAIDIVTNDAFRKSVQIPVRGYVEQAVWLEQSAIVLDRVRSGHEARAETKLSVADGFSPDKVRVRIPEGAPLEGKIGPGQGGTPCLLLTWRGAATPGWHRHTVQLEPNQGEGYLPTPLPVAVHVLPAVEVFPESVWLRDAEVAGDWSRRLTVRLPRTKELRVVVTDEEVAKRLQVRVSSKSEGEHLVTLGPRSSGALAPFQGRRVELELRTGDEVVRKIPVSLGEFRVAGRKEAPSSAEGSR